MERPLVSIITATRDRHAELQDCIEQVRAQVYRPLEHVIVTDGPDPYVKKWLTSVGELAAADRSGVPIVFQETGRCWSDTFAYSPGAAAFQVAQLLAHGPLQMWFSDDEEMDPDHVELLVDLLQRRYCDFVYSKAIWYTAPGLEPRSYIIGTFPPRPDTLTNTLYRVELLDYGKFETHRGRGTDWDQVSKWIEAGARYSFLDKVTFRHRADQIGGVCPNTTKQRLRGHRGAVVCS